MSRKFTILLTGTLVLVIIAFFAWQRVFRESETSVALEKPEIIIDLPDLLDSFQMNEDSANSMFLGKVIQVSGEIYDITEDSATYSVYLKGQNDLTGVMCVFNKPSSLPASAVAGAKARIKGICSGYLLDVILNKCAWVD